MMKILSAVSTKKKIPRKSHLKSEVVYLVFPKSLSGSSSPIPGLPFNSHPSTTSIQCLPFPLIFIWSSPNPNSWSTTYEIAQDLRDQGQLIYRFLLFWSKFDIGGVKAPLFQGGNMRLTVVKWVMRKWVEGEDMKKSRTFKLLWDHFESIVWEDKRNRCRRWPQL